MLSILQSIKPKYCELIASGKKTIEVRKTKPKIPTPFKVYIYETKNKTYQNLGFASPKDDGSMFCFVHKTGKVIGEYVCDYICTYKTETYFNEKMYLITEEELKQMCLRYEEFCEYGKGKTLYGWHISELKIYDNPKELSEFEIIDKQFLKECPYRLRVYNNPDFTNGALLKGSYICNNSCFEPDFCRGKCGGATKPLTRPPQSYCYVEEAEQE